MTVYVSFTAFTERFTLSEKILDTTSDIRTDITMDMTSDMILDMSLERKSDLTSDIMLVISSSSDLVLGHFWPFFLYGGIKHQYDIDSNMTKYYKPQQDQLKLHCSYVDSF